MRKILLAIVLSGAVLACASTDVIAQVTTKAYAPEDLGRLSEQDRVRVIEREYADQSRGRSIPDDQLEFYLDQIQSSRWSFSQIKEDIAISLGGGSNQGGWTPNPGPGPGGVEVRCESRNDRYVECPTGFRGPAVVARNLSSTRCVDGVNFGSLAGSVWVNRGCRATFVEGRFAPPPGGGSGAQINCESRDDRYRECRTNFRGRAELVRQMSDHSCVENRTWGNKPGVVWVNRGCRAVFAEARGGGGNYPGNDYSVTCNSDDGRRKTCAWNRREGSPRLIEQMSQTPCVEGRTWGFDRRDGLWVDRGCRARFGN